MYGILLIIVVIGLSGMIAYLGDRIGMKVGKKRISFFGLRPKYTSIIITILTGVLIASLSLSAIFVTNNVVRQAVFRIQEVVSQINNLNDKLATKDEQLNLMQDDIGEMGDEINRLKQMRDDLNQDLEQAKEEITVLEEKRKQLQKANEELKKENENLQSENKDLQEENEKLMEDNRELKMANETLSEQNTALKEQSQLLEEQIRTLEQQIEKVQHNFEAARNLAEQSLRGIDYYRGEDIVYQRGDIIYTGVIKSGMTGDETVEAVVKLLEKADQQVKKRPVMVEQETGTALHLLNEEIYGLVRTILQSKSEKVIVRLIASINVPRDGEVQAIIRSMEDFIVFEKDKLIAESIIDAEKDPGQLEHDLEELLTDIKVKAIKKGLLDDNQAGIITLDFSRFYELLMEIQRYDGRIKLEAYAREDIWREDMLSSNLEFKIKPLDDTHEESN